MTRMGSPARGSSRSRKETVKLPTFWSPLTTTLRVSVTVVPAASTAISRTW
jgi:hypothetical protein